MAIYTTSTYVMPGSHSFTVPATVSTVYYLAVGGGAGGNVANTAPGTHAEAGGGGELMYGSVSVTPGQTLTITVGAGGALASNGGDTTITGTGISITALGGYATGISRGVNNSTTYNAAVSINAYGGRYAAGTGGSATSTAPGPGAGVTAPSGKVYSNLGAGGSLLTSANGTPHTGQGGAGGALGRKYDQYGNDIGPNVDQYGNVGSYQAGGTGASGVVYLEYSIDYSAKSLSLSSVQTLFGGSNPTNISEYYANGGWVPVGTVGYPGNVATPIPSVAGTQIRFSNFQGTSNYVYYTASYVNSISTGNAPPTAATTAYFGTGNIGANYAWLTLNSRVSYLSLTMPDSGYPSRVTLSGGYGYIGVGYRYYTSCGLYGCSTSYYYDHMKSPGYRVYSSTGEYMGESRSTDASDVNWNTEGPNHYAQYRDFGNGFSFVAQPGETYSVYYVCDFYGETGLDYFSFQGYNIYCQVYTLKYIL